MKLAVRKLPHAQDLPLPAYASEGAAGLDLAAAIPSDIVIEPGHRFAVPTGLEIAIPEGYEGQVRPRSGLAMRHGLTVLNAPGTIDCDYRGEVKVLLVNLSLDKQRIARGDRIAQLVIAPVIRAGIVEVQVLDETARGPGGFGSTGGFKAAQN